MIWDLCFSHLFLLSRFEIVNGVLHMKKTIERCMTCSDKKKDKKATNIYLDEVYELVHVKVYGPTRT